MGWTTLFGAGARRTAPGGRARLVLAGACAAVLVACAWVGRSLLGSSSPETTLIRAYRFLDQPPRLDRALDASWRFAVLEGGGMARRAGDLLAPPLPPFLCAAGWPGADANEARRAPRRLRTPRFTSSRVVARTTQATKRSPPVLALTRMVLTERSGG